MSEPMGEVNRETSPVESYPATVGELKEKLNQFDDDQPIAGHTTDGDGNYFLYPVDVVRMSGNNDRVLIDLTPTEAAE